MLCDYINNAMIEKKMDIETLSKKSGIQKTCLFKYLNGLQVPNLISCKKLIRALDLDPVRIFDEIDK